MLDVVINGRVNVPGTAGMSVDVGGGVIRDATLMKQFVVADAPIADTTRTDGLVTVTSAPTQIEDARTWKRGSKRVFRQATVYVYATAEGCSVTVVYDGNDSVKAEGLWAQVPTIKVDGVSIVATE